MNEPSHVLANGTKIVTSIALSSTTGIMVSPKYLAARQPGKPGTTQGYVPGHGGDIYWVVHDDETVAVYGWAEMELTNQMDIEKNKTDLEVATDALLAIVESHTPKDMVYAAAQALAKIGAPLPEETPPAVVAFYEEAKA